VRNGVELAIAACVDSVTNSVAAGRVQRCGAGVAGEVSGRGEPGGVADVAEQFRGEHDADAVQGGASRGPRITGPGFVGLDAGVELAQVGEQVFGEVAAAGVGGGGRLDPAQQGAGFVGGQVGVCAAGISSRSSWCSRLSTRVRSCASSSRRSESSRRTTVWSSGLTARSAGWCRAA
jgi:hypothetical protein